MARRKRAQAKTVSAVAISAVPATAPKIGYDGNPPEFGVKRGSEVRDSLTGEIIREAEVSPLNVNLDRIEWLYAHKKIDQAQYDAARKLQSDCQIAEIMNYASPALVGGGTQCGFICDAKIDAMKRVNAARAVFVHYWPGWKLIELVAVENYSTEKATAIMRRPHKWGPSALADALDMLAKHYRLA